MRSCSVIFTPSPRCGTCSEREVILEDVEILVSEARPLEAVVVGVEVEVGTQTEGVLKLLVGDVLFVFPGRTPVREGVHAEADRPPGAQGDHEQGSANLQSVS